MRTRSASRRRLCRRAWCRSSRPRSPSSSRTTTCSTRCACSPPRSGEARTASASTARATCWSRASSTWRSWTATLSCGHRLSAACCEGRRCVARWSSLRSTLCRAASWRESCRRLGGVCCLWSRPLCTRLSAPASLQPPRTTPSAECLFTARLHSSPAHSSLAHSSLVHGSLVQFTARRFTACHSHAGPAHRCRPPRGEGGLSSRRRHARLPRRPAGRRADRRREAGTGLRGAQAAPPRRRRHRERAPRAAAGGRRVRSTCLN
mmetsp:Transcript_21052/g.62286  ORF Transcript_21052/g.62286 Transcript_21052/m.62286 type:complete len:263 (+) Transcript_21052:566-1354(+)